MTDLGVLNMPVRILEKVFRAVILQAEFIFKYYCMKLISLNANLNNVFFSQKQKSLEKCINVMALEAFIREAIW